MFTIIILIESRQMIVTIKPRQAFSFGINFLRYFLSVYFIDMSISCSNSWMVIIIISIIHWTRFSFKLLNHYSILCLHSFLSVLSFLSFLCIISPKLNQGLEWMITRTWNTSHRFQVTLISLVYDFHCMYISLIF